jgi:esterase/lipase superfamily enzyme
MNFVFISPHFPHTYWQFCQRLSQNGVRVLAIADVHYDLLRSMPADHPYWDLYRHRRIVMCVGQGAWEDELLDSTRQMDALLKEKNVPAWIDYWGHDVAHDWAWWRKQVVYFMQHILTDAGVEYVI